MRFNLADLAKGARNRRRKAVTFRDIRPPSTFATNLYAAVYAPVVAIWTRRTDAILAEYERSLSALTTDAAGDINNELDQAENEFLRLVLSLRVAMSDWLFKVEKWERSKFIGATLAATDVDLSTMLTSNDVSQPLSEVLEWNVSLVRDINSQARQRIATAVFNGLRSRSPARDVAAEIRKATGMARDRSLRVAADQLQKTTARLAQARAEQAGITKYVWVHSRKAHPRQNHVERDGKIFEWSDPPADGPPGTQPYCGCRARAYLEWLEE